MKHGENKAKLTDGPLKKILFRMTVPMVYGIAGMIAFNLIDTFYVGQLGPDELAAMTFTFPLIFVINGINFGIGAGASAVISKAIGNNDFNKVKRLTTDALTLALVLVFIVVVSGLSSIDPLFRAMDAEEKLLPLIREYMQVWYFGAIFVVIPMVGNNAIRATGDTKTPSNIMLVSVAANLILDPIFIFDWGLGLGLTGAALATVISRMITFIVALRILYYREKMITFKMPSLAEGLASWKAILYIGLPSGATNIITPVGIGIITKMVAGYGTAAVAALGVAQRVEAFSLTVMMALGSALGPIIGQNWGAKKFDRVERVISHSVKFSMLYGLGAAAVLAVSAPFIAGLFSDDREIISIISYILRIIPMSYTLMGIIMVSNVSLNVLNKPLIASFVTLFRIFGALIPLAYLASYFIGLNGIFWAVNASNFIIGAAAFYILKYVIGSERRKAESLAAKV